MLHQKLVGSQEGAKIWVEVINHLRIFRLIGLQDSLEGLVGAGFQGSYSGFVDNPFCFSKRAQISIRMGFGRQGRSEKSKSKVKA